MMPRFAAIDRRLALKAADVYSPAYPPLGWLRAPNLANFDFSAVDLTTNSVVAIALAWLRRNIHRGQIVCGIAGEKGEYEEVEDHPLTTLLGRPNPWDSWRATLGGTCDAICLDGNAYWIKGRSGDGTVKEIWWVPNNEVSVEPETDPARQRESGPIRCYWHSAGDDPWRKRRYEPEDVVHFREGRDPYARHMGLSDLKRQIRNAYGLDAGERYTAAILRNAHAGKILAPKDGSVHVLPDSPEEVEMIRLGRRIEGGVSGENAGRITKSSIPVDLLDAGLGPEQMLIDRILDRPESYILASLGLNALTLGLPSSKDTATYANKGEARREAWENAVLPRQDLVADEVQQQLLPDFPDPPATDVWWDRRDVEALREDADQRAQRTQVLFASKALPRNRALSEGGFDPVDGEAGDLYSDDPTPRQAEDAAAQREHDLSLYQVAPTPDAGLGGSTLTGDGVSPGGDLVAPNGRIGVGP